MREYIEIVEGFMHKAFGRKGVTPGMPEPQRPDYRATDAMHIASRYSSAEEYADDNNPIVPMNTDPDHVHQRYEDERSRLIRDWERWHDAGYITVSGGR